ncbi:MAG: nickel-responsive transcriptional regulator NikR [Planctomycetes bacterium]|nr:nickel-responsive transcriptional regulator NikR [Planctomycetota bacterium]
MSKLIRFGVSMDEDLLAKFDRLISKRKYVNRSEAIRDLVRNTLIETEWEKGSGKAVGAVTLVYNHDEMRVSDRLLHAQHEHASSVISSMHVHLDEDHCLEVIILKGESREIRHIADDLIGSRGVKHGRLVMTTTGEGLA